MAYYLIRVGEGSKYIGEAKSNGFVAVGWNEVPDLRNYEAVDDIKNALSQAGYEYTTAQLAAEIYSTGLLGSQS